VRTVLFYKTVLSDFFDNELIKPFKNPAARKHCFFRLFHTGAVGLGKYLCDFLVEDPGKNSFFPGRGIGILQQVF